MKKPYKINSIEIDKKKILADFPIIDFPYPKTVKVPLSGHIGGKSVAIVNLGDIVLQGSLIANKTTGISANTHSPISGKVIELSQDYVVIEAVKKNKKIKVLDEEALTDIIDDKALILSKISNAGIVGMGGAGFPTFYKLSLDENDKISTLIINGIECEPYISTDTRLMIEKATQIVIGARIVNKILGIQNAVIVIDDKNTKAYEVLKHITRSYIGVNVVQIKSSYPQGSEKMLIKALYNQEISNNKLPKDYGFIVQNVSTIYAIYEAVMKDKPLYERVISITGDTIEKQGNYRVLVGTLISDIMKELEIDPDNFGCTIINGQMMGRVVVDFDSPITKRDTCLLFFDKKIEKPEESPCIRCNQCSDKCPISLQPFDIAKNYKLGKVQILEKLYPKDCIGCGICSYICPAKIPLLEYINLAKSIINKVDINVQKK